MTNAITPAYRPPTEVSVSRPQRRRERTPSLRDSLREIGALRCAMRTSRGRAERPRSDEVYAATTHVRLARVSPRAAQEFMTRLGEELQAGAPRSRRPQLIGATDRVMTSLVRDGYISGTVRTEIRQAALERATTDEDRARTGSQTAPERALPVADAIAAATRQPPTPAPSSSRAEASSGGRAPSSKGPSIGISAPTGFLWKPFSDSDGLLAILLPTLFTGNALSVEIISPDGTTVLATGRPAGVGNGGREHFRFNRPGDAFPPGCQVRVTTRDGSVAQYTIPSPGIRNEGRG